MSISAAIVAVFAIHFVGLKLYSFLSFGVDFTVHILIGFVISIGGRNRRPRVEDDASLLRTRFNFAQHHLFCFDFIFEYVFSALVLAAVVN